MRAISIAALIASTAVLLTLSNPASAERERPKLDLDGDGYVTPEEYSQSPLSERRDFSSIDTNGDNLLTREELKSIGRQYARRGGERPILDLDDDGVITPEEFSQSPLSERVEFSSIDSDGDNQITSDEMRQFAREHRGPRGRWRQKES